MKFAVVLFAVFALAVAGPITTDSKDAVILRYENDNIGVGGYKWDVETSDGQARSETAEVRNPGQENEHLAVRGSYSWTVEGVTYTVNYVADENGFQPDAPHLPKSVV